MKYFSPPVKRLGTKTKILAELLYYFPEHDAYFETHVGSGAVVFNKPKAKYTFVNDYDANIALTYNLIQDENKLLELVDWLEMLPYSSVIWEQLKDYEPKNEVEQVGIFLIFSNWGYLGMPNTLKFSLSNSKEQTIINIKSAAKRLSDGSINWHCADFEVFLKSIALRDKDLGKSFIYADPPYIGTDDNYQTPDKWNINELERLIKVCIAKGCKFAISEFDSPGVLELAEKYNLVVNIIGEVKNIKNRRTEILMTNYRVVKQYKMF